MKVHLIAIASLLTLSGTSFVSAAETAYGGWHSSRIGGGGYVMNVVPTSDPKIDYVYTDVGGFYRSDDAGETWRMLHGALPATHGNQEPRSLVVSPTDPDVILVANGSHWQATREGVDRSSDGGKTFERTLEAAFAGNGNERMMGTVLAVDPFHPNVVLAAAMQDGVFRSEDFGKTWKSVGLKGTNPTDIEFDATTEDRVLLTSRPYNFFLLGSDHTMLEAGLFESTDGGKTWNAILSDDSAPYEFVQAGPTFGNDWIAVFPPSDVKRSADGGRTWSDFGEGLPEGDKSWIFDDRNTITPEGSVVPHSFMALGAGPDFLLVGAGDGQVYRRGKGDAKWSAVGGTATAPESWYGNPGNRPGWVHFGKAISSLVVDPFDPKTWWLTDWYMLWKSNDAGRNWRYAGDGIELTCLHNLTQAPDDPGLVYLGMGDNGFFRSFDGGASFVQRWKGITNNVKDVAVSPKDAARLYAIGPEQDGHWYSSQVFVSDDRGSNWRPAGMGNMRNVESRRINSIAADPNDRDTVYVTVAGPQSELGGVFRSTDAGETWSPLNDGLPDEALFRGDIWHVGREIAVSSDGSMVAISHNSSRIFAFDPKTEVWSEMQISAQKPNSVAADPFVPGHYLLAALNGGLFNSEDGGVNWLPTDIVKGSHHVAFDQVKAGRVVVGTDDGVEFSDDDGASWRSLDAALPNRRGNMVAFAGDRVVVGTTGTGAFWYPLTPEAAKPIAAKTVDAPTSSDGPSENLALNGSFDQPGKDRVPADWNLRWSDTNTLVEPDETTFASAPASLNMSVDPFGYAVVEQQLPADLQGKWLTVSGTTKVEGEFEEIMVSVQLMNESEEQIAWLNVFLPESRDTNWQPFSKTIELPTSYDKAFLLYHVRGQGSVWLDDVVVTAEDPR